MINYLESMSQSEDPTTTLLLVRRLAMPIYLPAGLIAIGSGMLLPTIPLALKEEGFSYLVITAVLAAAGVGSLIAQIPFGRLLSSRSEKHVMILSLVLVAASTAPLGVTSLVLVLCGLRLANGVGSTGGLLARQTYMTRAIPSGLRGRAMSLFGGTNRIAFLIGPLLGGYTADRLGFNGAFLIASLITLTGLVPLLRMDAGQADQATPEQAGSHPLAVFAAHRRSLSTAGAAQVCIIGVRYGRFAILPLVGESIGLTTTQIGVLIAIGSAADVLLFPVAGYLMDHHGRLAAIVPSFSLLGIGLLLLAGSHSHQAIALSAAAIGIGNGLGAGTMMTLSSDLAPSESPSEYLAALGTIRESGRIVGPLAVGLFADQYGLAQAAVMLACVSFCGVAIMIFGVGETKPAELTRTKKSQVSAK